MAKTPRQKKFNDLTAQKTPIVRQNGRKYVMPLGMPTMRG